MRFGERGAGAGEQMAGKKKGLAKVAGDDFIGIADGGEVDAGIPAKQ